MRYNLTTDRLVLRALYVGDAEFITELVNTPGWLTFIGDRQVYTVADAVPYIEKIVLSPDIDYWVVTLNDSGEPVGVVSFIKRPHLEHRDIGFAFLPQYGKRGYAFEAAAAVLEEVVRNPGVDAVLATTLKENDGSIRLLERLGLEFDQELVVEGRVLLLYKLGL